MNKQVYISNNNLGTDINMNDPKVIGVLNSIRMDEEKYL